MGYCDWGHEAEDVRQLPIGSNANVYLCRTHYESEMEMRRENEDSRGEPRWEDLVEQSKALQG